MEKISQPYQESRFEYKGFTCVVLFLPLGHRCGYVGIPNGHKCYGISYEKLDNIGCHGGLTYSRPYLADQEESNIWWIGFDCSHWGDKADSEKAREYFNDERVMEYIVELERFHIGGEVRTLEYVESECRKIVDQLQMLSVMARLEV